MADELAQLVCLMKQSLAQANDQKDFSAVNELVQNAEIVFCGDSYTSSGAGMSWRVFYLWLSAVSQCAHLLNGPGGDPFISLVCKMDARSSPQEVWNRYVNVVQNVVSLHPHKALVVVESTVGQISPRPVQGVGYDPNSSPGPDFVYHQLTTAVEHVRVHELAMSLIDIIPTLSGEFLSALKKAVPHSNFGPESHLSYVFHILKMAEYMPALADSLLKAAVKHILDMDVRVSAVVEREEEEAGDLGVFGLDHPRDPRMPLTSVTGSRVPVAVERSSLDFMMALLMEWLHHTAGKSLNLSNKIFGSLLEAFDTIIIPTHQCRVVQFVVFFAGHFHTDYSGFLLEYLHHKVGLESNYLPARLSALGYIASFMARASYTPINVLRAYVATLVQMCEKHIEKFFPGHCGFEDQRMGPASWPALLPQSIKEHSAAHAVFAATVQTLCYVLVFRGEELADPPSQQEVPLILEDGTLRGPEGLPPTLAAEANRSGCAGRFGWLRMADILSCPLEPLRLCNTELVSSFCEMARFLGIADVRKFATPEKGPGVHLRLPTGVKIHAPFFPFEPYHLPTISHSLSPIYKNFEEFSPSGFPLFPSEEEAHHMDGLMQERMAAENNHHHLHPHLHPHQATSAAQSMGGRSRSPSFGGASGGLSPGALHSGSLDGSGGLGSLRDESSIMEMTMRSPSRSPSAAMTIDVPSEAQSDMDNMLFTP